MRRFVVVLAGALLLVGQLAMAVPPLVQPPSPFASGIGGPEGLAFGTDGSLYVGTQDGDLLRVALDGTHTLVASLGEEIAGLTVAKDGHLLACAFSANRVWSIDPSSGAATVYANVDSPNFVVQTHRGQVIVSSSFTGSLVDITGGAHVVLASGLSFPNGLALRGRDLYMADTVLSAVLRFPFTSPGALGTPETYASGLTFADGIAFDRSGNLFVVGADTLWVVDAKTRTTQSLSTDPLLDWPSNIAFGRTPAFGREAMYLANYGFPLGGGTTVVRVPTNHRGAKLIR
jgi:sugar lactone lactonase YvrE